VHPGCILQSRLEESSVDTTSAIPFRMTLDRHAINAFVEGESSRVARTPLRFFRFSCNALDCFGARVLVVDGVRHEAARDQDADPAEALKARRGPDS
jgi:hypothetical protein